MCWVDTLVEGWQAAWDAARGVPEHEVPLLIFVLTSPVSGMGTSLVLQTCVLTSLPSCRYLATVATGVGGGGDRITLGLDEKIARYSPFGEDLGRLKRKILLEINWILLTFTWFSLSDSITTKLQFASVYQRNVSVDHFGFESCLP